VSLIVSEFSQILYRVVVISPTQKTLRDFFESLSFDLVTHPKLKKNSLKLSGAAISGDHVQAWLSFTLGMRSNLDLRLSFVGFSLDKNLPSNQVMSFCDGFLFHVAEDKKKPEVLDALFSLEVSEELRAVPLLCVGLEGVAEDLRKRAFEEFIKRNFTKYMALQPEQSFLSDGLEWFLIH
jgi:hypothetical protein